MTTAQFWRQLPFSYLETYSFNREPHGAARTAAMQAVQEARLTVEQGRYLQQGALTQQLRTLEATLHGGSYQARLTAADGSLDATAERLAVITQGSAVARQMQQLFEAPTAEVLYAMCPPIYRDALAFYDAAGRRLRVLNICFGCLFMTTDENVTVEADHSIYEQLGDLLRQLGHPIMDNEY